LNDDVIKDYKLFFTSPMELQHLIEIKKSLFFDGSEFNPTSFSTFKTIEEYLNYIKDNFIGEKKLFFNETFDKTLDYFKLRGAEPFISKDLKETFEIAGVTGIKFMEATEPELAFED
ncbi:MAG: hypothetical protein O9353_11970, partial [Bacteroidia bacterium]|nr:hypothetical protein [Bacteroidia bacterium]